MINKQRLGETFKFLVGIDSVSRDEKAISDEIVKIVESMGAETIVDGAGTTTGSNTGNLVVRYKGNATAPPLLISAHLDTVEPGKGVTVVFKDGIFTSDGTTILGADDKSAIAIILEALTVIHENKLTSCPLELVFTICEEIGLQGAKNLDFTLISATYGYILDTQHTEEIVTRAPAANNFEFRVHGKDAHAGASPEDGINAISLAGKAIAELELGRIDHETTCNIGMIEGGIARNIVPNLVTVKGEVRSHDPDKLDKLTDKIKMSFKDVIEANRKFSSDTLPDLEISIELDFPKTYVPDDHPVVTLAQKAAANLGRKIDTRSTGGGADANILFSKGIITGVLGTGMKDMHTVRESIRLDDMVRTAELLLEIILLHTEEYGG